MSKPIVYFGLDVIRNPLLKDMTELWGDGLDSLSEADKLWLIARIGHEAWMEEPTSQPPTDEAEQVVERLHELSYAEKLLLLEALSS